MKYRRLGTAGLEVSEVGFGAWGIGGSARGVPAYGPTDDRESRRALRRAFELGVTFYDTAALYGDGHSEQLIGETFQDVRGRIVIASKVGLLDADGAQNFSPSHIRASLEGSLRRLKTEYVDLYQLHDPALELLAGDGRALETLERLQHEGKIRAVGMTARSPEEAVRAITCYGIACVQVNFNMLDQRARQHGLLTLCGNQHVGLILRTPLCFGFLTGAYSSDSAFDVTDHRSRWPQEQRVRWAQAVELFTSIRDTCEQTFVQLALRFCLSYPEVSTVIPGMLTPAHVEENIRASDLGPLTLAQQRQIEQLYQRHEFFLGRRAASASRQATPVSAAGGEARPRV